MSRTQGLLILLVTRDAERSCRLAAICREAEPDVECIECSDEFTAMFAAPSERIDMIVLDGCLTRERRGGWVTSLRRLAMGGMLLLLNDDPWIDENRLRTAVERAMQRASMPAPDFPTLRPAA